MDIVTARDLTIAALSTRTSLFPDMPRDVPRAAAHESGFYAAQQAGFSSIAYVEHLVELFSNQPARILTFGFDDGEEDAWMDNPHLDSMWEEIEAAGVLAARTNAPNILIAQQRDDMVTQAINAGLRRAALWDSMDDAIRDRCIARLSNPELELPALAA